MTPGSAWQRHFGQRRAGYSFLRRRHGWQSRPGEPDRPGSGRLDGPRQHCVRHLCCSTLERYHRRRRGCRSERDLGQRRLRDLAGAGATGLVIQSNFIGTDATGSLPRGNTYIGIGIGAPGAVIGGLSTSPGTASGNLISANEVGHRHRRVADTAIEGNIDRDATASGVSPRQTRSGHWYRYRFKRQHAGSALPAGAGNLISGNSVVGVESECGSREQSNRGATSIGTNLAGGAAVRRRP